MIRNHSDGLLRFAQSRWGQTVLKTVGIPVPVQVCERNPNNVAVNALVCEVAGRSLPFDSAQLDRGLEAITPALPSGVSLSGRRIGLLHCDTSPSSSSSSPSSSSPLADALHGCGAHVVPLPSAVDKASLHGVVLDATSLCSAAARGYSVDAAEALFTAAQAALPLVRRGGRITVAARHPAALQPLAPSAVAADSADAPDLHMCLGDHAFASGVKGFVKALSQEMGRQGTTVNLLHTPSLDTAMVAGPLSFLQSVDSAFVTSQTLVAAPAVEPPSAPPDRSRKVAVVTGAAQGIGRSITERLAQEGFFVLAVDVPGQETALEALRASTGGAVASELMDVTAPTAPEQLRDRIERDFGVVDALVHNAGITADRTLRRMKPAQIRNVLEVNLGSILRMNAELLRGGADSVVADDGRIVLMSSISGIAGAAGQTNYSLTKAALTGHAAALATVLADRRITVNAIAPGFIETDMTAAMPWLPRETARRMSAFSQGGLPSDIAAATAFLTSPAAFSVSGQTLRVCGGHVVGA